MLCRGWLADWQTLLGWVEAEEELRSTLLIFERMALDMQSRKWLAQGAGVWHLLEPESLRRLETSPASKKVLTYLSVPSWAAQAGLRRPSGRRPVPR
jgi:hypothetical protein